MQKNKKYNIKEAIERIQSYCALQDRCRWEVEKKIKEWGVKEDIIENILSDLILEKFIDEQRFAESFCRGKFRIKRWGKIKIKNELKLRKISVSCINKGLEQIDDKEYYSDGELKPREDIMFLIKLKTFGDLARIPVINN